MAASKHAFAKISIEICFGAATLETALSDPLNVHHIPFKKKIPRQPETDAQIGVENRDYHHLSQNSRIPGCW
jgi:hypothetical protein